MRRKLSDIVVIALAVGAITAGATSIGISAWNYIASPPRIQEDRKIIMRYDSNKDGRIDDSELTNFLRDYQLQSK